MKNEIVPEYTEFEHEPILWHLLSTKRPNYSKGIQGVINHIINLAPPGSLVKTDKLGSLWIDTRFDKSRTMFAAHLDTVEKKGQEGKIPIEITPSGIVRSIEHNAVMGVDDGGGVAMIVSFLLAGIPALYLFTQGEECGGLPAKFAINDPWVHDLDRCIAFDRKGTKDIVADQARGILASRTFVEDLSSRLGMGHSWAIGSYTDSSEFYNQIKEIVNISIGYEANHTAWETLDYNYFKALRKVCLTLDWETLPTIGGDKSAGRNSISKYWGGGYAGKGSNYSNPAPGYSRDLYSDDDYYDVHLPKDKNLAKIATKTPGIVKLEKMERNELPIDPPDLDSSDVLDMQPWDVQAELLADSLGFGVEDICLIDELTQYLKEMYDLGVTAGMKQGRKDAFRYFRAHPKAYAPGNLN